MTQTPSAAPLASTLSTQARAEPATRRSPAAYEQSQHAVLVSQHAPLVRRIALRMIGRLPANIELDDLIQAGMLGLLDAVRRYREVPTAQFETYATQRIRGAMLDELRRLDWMPRGVRERSRRVEEATQLANQQLGRQANESEIAATLEIPLEEYQQMLQESHGSQLLYLDELTSEGELTLTAESSEDPFHASATDDPLAALMAKGLRSALIEAIEALPEREKLVLSLYYEQDLNLKEIGLVLEVTEARVSQLRSQAVARLRTHLAQSR